VEASVDGWRPEIFSVASRGRKIHRDRRHEIDTLVLHQHCCCGVRPPIVGAQIRGAVMSWLRQLFVWWLNATPGTLITTWWSGTPVGKDDFGNRYYQTKDGKRRWVIYVGTVEASRVPPEWHGWLHHTFALPPTVDAPKPRAWEAPHQPNLTGTSAAYHPDGSLWAEGKRPPATGDYEAWRPS
jgi:NADH:ubiquinone oxidoreductase subunit